jgi:hypothetical protein
MLDGVIYNYLSPEVFAFFYKLKMHGVYLIYILILCGFKNIQP